MRSRSMNMLNSCFFPLVGHRVAAVVGLSALFCFGVAFAQSDQQPKGTIRDGFAVHQTIDFGGRIANEYGSLPMYDTLVNMQSGTRVLQQSLQMNAVPGQKHSGLYDSLLLTNFGYGGDPQDSTFLKMSKGKIYDFQGNFRRSREYFDYDLLDNPLIPAGVTSNGYTFPQVLHSPHMYNTVRRMTDTSLTLMPRAKVSYRFGYSHNMNQGPSYSSFHNGAEAQFLQNWRNSSDSWFGAVQWKPRPMTMVTLQETITHNKVDTTWQLAGANLQLPNGGGPVSLGYDQVHVPSCGDGNPPILDSTTNPPTINPTCPGYESFNRSEPVRVIFPTEELRFQSSDLKNLQVNGRVRYTGASMNLPQFNENFIGLDNFGIREWNITGYSKAERVNVSADFGAVWQISPRVTLSEQYDFWNFRQPADNYLSEIDHLDDVALNSPAASPSSMSDPIGAAQPPAITTAHNFLGQKTETNNLALEWKALPRATFTIGYIYRARTIGYEMPLITDFLANGTSYKVMIHENGGLLGVLLHPTAQWKVDATIEAAYLDNAYVQIDPRQRQRYQVHSMWTPNSIVTISAALDDLERRDGQAVVNHQDHSRNFGFGAEIAPSTHYGVDLDYGYTDAFSRTGICYAASDPLPGASPTAPADCGTNTYLGSGYYDEPTQSGSVDFMYAPTDKVKSHLGYRMNAVDGTTEFLNPREVPGSLQSKYETPFANVTWIVKNGLGFRGEWNYYSYGEDGPPGPTLARNFHTNLYTLGVHYEF